MISDEGRFGPSLTCGSAVKRTGCADRFTVGEGEFYDGDRGSVAVELAWRPSRHFQPA